MPDPIYVILDPNFGENLADLPREIPIWIVDSPENTPVARRLWLERPDEDYYQGVTTFQPVLTPEEILDVIREHHGDELALNIIGTITP
jgi:hypothetical protein